MAVTMKDIATAAQISRPTVSLILNGRGDDLRIAEATRERVIETARRLGYHRNELARAVKRGRTNVIAFIGGTGSYVMDIISGINISLQKHGFLLKLFILNDDSNFADVTRQCLEQMVAGVICRALSEEQLVQLRTEMTPSEIPVIQVDNSFVRDWCGRVVSDDINGGRLAVNHLLELGHRRIGLVTAGKPSGYAVLRRQGYHEALVAAGIQITPELEIAMEPNAEWNAEQELLLIDYLTKFRPSAVFCVSDPLAMKILQAAHRAGIQVPSELSVVGYANLDFAAFSTPPLTTIAQPFIDIGEIAADNLVRELYNNTAIAKINQELPVQMVVRQSTAPVSHK